MELCSYFDGKTAQAHECKVHFSHDTIHLYLINQNNKLIIWGKDSIVDYNMNGDVLIVKYGDFPHQTLEFKGSGATTAFNELAQNNIEKQTQGLLLNNKATIAIALSVAFVAICFLSYFVLLPWIGEKSSALIPKDVEVSLGNSIAETVTQSNTKNDSATYYANQFVSKLKLPNTYNITVTVIESEEINAFALPGGKIFVYSSIIKGMNSYQEFAALLGHEISHVTYQHSLKSICRSAASSFFIAFLFGDVSGITSGILQQADKFKQLNYSRELETQADDEGYQVMLNNHISPKGMIDLLTLLQKESKDVPGMMKYFSTHPETQERIDNIKSKAESQKVFNENEELKQLFVKLKSELD